MLFRYYDPISLNELRAFLASETGDSAAQFSPISLNSAAARYTAGKHTGSVSLDDFRGKYACFIRAPSFSPAPAVLYTESLPNVGSNGGISVSLSRGGKLTIRSHTYTGANVAVYINDVQMPGFYGADVLQKNCAVSVVRNSWNGVGECPNNYSYTPAVGWATVGFSLSFLGNATAEATYTLSVQDLLNPTNNISFTTTLRLTP